MRIDTTALGPDLLTTWDRLMRPCDEPTRVLVAAINDELGTGYDSNRYGKWRRGDEAMPAPVQALMRRDVLRYLLGDADGDALASALEVRALRTA